MKKKNQRPKSQLQAAECILQKLMEQQKGPLSDQFLRWRLAQNWPEIVQGEFGKRCRPIDYQRGTLILGVESNAWMHELQFFLPLIQQKVNESVGRTWVRRIQLKICSLQ